MAERCALDRDLWHPPQIVGSWSRCAGRARTTSPRVVRWYRDPEVARLTRYQTRPMNQAEIERFFEVRDARPDALAYSIVELPRWRLIGFTTFSSLDGDNGSVMFHITIGERDAWGRGLGTEATRADAGARVRTAGPAPRGTCRVSRTTCAPSSAYEKAGFRIEGRLREAILRDGRYFDEVQMGILAGEWFERSVRTRRMPEEVVAG